MRNTYLYFFGLLLFLCLLPERGKGQAAIFDLCARQLTGSSNDSLTWSSANLCTNFTGYVVFSGPTASNLQPIDTITDPAQLGELYIYTASANRFYQVGMLCGASILASSAVIDNARPITPNIQSVDLQTGVPVLRWSASPSPGIIGYQIYKENPYGSGNFFPYPANNQLVSGTQFTDVNSADLLVRYAIVAVSNCNKGPLGEGTLNDGTTGPHSSIFLSSNFEPCSRRLDLNWNAYENWADGVAGYLLWMEENGGSPQLVDTVLTTTYSYLGAEDGQQLRFWVEAMEENGSYRANSNVLDFNISANRPIDFLELTDLSYAPANAGIDVHWRWDLDSDFAEGRLQRSTDGQQWEDRLVLNSQSSQQNSYLDVNIDSAGGPYYYRIIAQDLCGLSYSSNQALSLELSGEALDNFENRLDWSPLQGDSLQAEFYQLYALEQGQWQQISFLDSSQRTFLDPIDLTDPEQANRCYYVQAEGRLKLANGQYLFLSSRSNEFCLQQKPLLHFPNALAPDGRNPTFRPRAALGQNIGQYRLQIYDRYGALIFESVDIMQGWDGKIKGRPAPQGVYIYLAQYQLEEGKDKQQKGSLFLLR